MEIVNKKKKYNTYLVSVPSIVTYVVRARDKEEALKEALDTDRDDEIFDWDNSKIKILSNNS